MEPISLILAALVAGTAETASSLVKDTYEGLKTLIKRKFADNSAAKLVLEEHEKDPETYEIPLKKKLIEADIDQDEQIIKKAQELLTTLKPEEAKLGKFNINIAGDVKGIVGDISGGTINQSIS
jgi:hypothetical protein